MNHPTPWKRDDDEICVPIRDARGRFVGSTIDRDLADRIIAAVNAVAKREAEQHLPEYVPGIPPEPAPPACPFKVKDWVQYEEQGLQASQGRAFEVMETRWCVTTSGYWEIHLGPNRRCTSCYLEPYVPEPGEECWLIMTGDKWIGRGNVSASSEDESALRGCRMQFNETDVMYFGPTCIKGFAPAWAEPPSEEERR